MSKAGAYVTAWSLVALAAAGCSSQAQAQAQAPTTPATRTAPSGSPVCTGDWQCLAQQAHLAGAPVLGSSDSADVPSPVVAYQRGPTTWQVAYSYHRRALNAGLVTVAGVHGDEWSAPPIRKGRILSVTVRGVAGTWFEGQRVLQFTRDGWHWGLGFPDGTTVEQVQQTAASLIPYG